MIISSNSLRPFLHRLRGVKIGPGVFIGEEVYLDNEHPESIEIHENAQISIRAVIVAHTRGPGKVVIGKSAFIGPNCTLVCGAGRSLKIGDGAVVGAGSVVSRSIPPHLYVTSAGPKPVARVGVPLPEAQSMESFWAGLTLGC